MSATGRCPRIPASGLDQCSTSTCRAPALLRPTPLPMPPSRNPAPHLQRSHRPPATCTSRAAPNVRRRRHIPVAPRFDSLRYREDRQPWYAEPRLRPARELQQSVHPAALAVAAANHLPAAQEPKPARSSRQSGYSPGTSHMQNTQISPWNIPLLLTGSYLIEPTEIPSLTLLGYRRIRLPIMSELYI
jgi:hypothetical protein